MCGFIFAHLIDSSVVYIIKSKIKGKEIDMNCSLMYNYGIRFLERS